MAKKPLSGQSTELLGTSVAQLQRCTLRGLTAGIEPVAAQVGASALSVGQGEANQVRVADPSVSRFHFELVREHGGLFIRDLGSTNGTLVEGVFVREARLSPGQRIRAGRAEFVIEIGDDTSEVVALSSPRYGQLVGSSEPMRVLFALMDKAAHSDATVLIQGETGTGKELVAEEIHRHSDRRDGPLVVVDCGALPENLTESELFGHEKGAFTGAVGERAGAFEEAAGGTLFLDEIGELPLGLQPKLLRALEARTIRRVGSNKSRRVDVRYIAATNRNLRSEVNAGAFREDLFWRLSVVELRVPPLRERRQDIPVLINELWQRSRGGGSSAGFDAETLQTLGGLPWRGNVRELRNFVERTAVLGAVELPVRTFEEPGGSAQTTPGIRFDLPYTEAKTLWTDHFELQYLNHRLAAVAGNQSQLSREANMDRTFLLKLMRKHGLR